jgi:Kef-type K+ transport system membrane component KefB
VQQDGLLGLIAICLLVFERLGVGSIVAFLVAGVLIGEIRDLPPDTALALREFGELGVILLLFLIGLETTPPQLRGLERDPVRLKHNRRWRGNWRILVG